MGDPTPQPTLSTRQPTSPTPYPTEEDDKQDKEPSPNLWTLVGNGECNCGSGCFLREEPSAGLEDCQAKCEAEATCQSIAIGLQNSGGDFNLCQLLGETASGHDSNGIFNCWSRDKAQATPTSTPMSA